MSKWRVRKRDGVWVVLDGAGRLRFCADNHRMAFAFASLRGPRADQSGLIYRTKEYLRILHEKRAREIWQALEQTDYEDDDE